MEWGKVSAVLFDLDGVLTPTAEVHMRAWQQVFTQWFGVHNVAPPYTSADYYAYVDGRPRYDGVRAALASRGVVIDDGVPDDPPDAPTVCGLGNAKNAVLQRMLQEDPVAPYEGATDLLDALAARGVAVAVVSGSRNAHAVLTAAGLIDRFGVIVDGLRAAAEGLAGKPAPDTFVRAAELLGVPVDQAAVVEDAVSGVGAGHAGGFGCVIGVDRGVGAQALLDAGADAVVRGLGELVSR